MDLAHAGFFGWMRDGGGWGIVGHVRGMSPSPSSLLVAQEAEAEVKAGSGSRSSACACACRQSERKWEAKLDQHAAAIYASSSLLACL